MRTAQVLAGEASDEVEAHVDSSRDAGGRHQIALIDPTRCRLDARFWMGAAQVIDVFPMRRDPAAVDEAGGA